MTRLKRKDLDFRQYLKKFSSLNYFNENRERAMKWCNYIPKKKKKKKKLDYLASDVQNVNRRMFDV